MKIPTIPGHTGAFGRPGHYIDLDAGTTQPSGAMQIPTIPGHTGAFGRPGDYIEIGGTAPRPPAVVVIPQRLGDASATIPKSRKTRTTTAAPQPSTQCTGRQ